MSGNSFLPIRIPPWITTVVCQSPSCRGTHFYFKKFIKSNEQRACVNPLHIGELISTRTLSQVSRGYGRTVSIPFMSGNSFLRRNCRFWSFMDNGVNPLHVGELISTFSLLCTRSRSESCVNPLHVGELISTNRAIVSSRRRKLCQSPSCRGTHFYEICCLGI